MTRTPPHAGTNPLTDSHDQRDDDDTDATSSVDFDGGLRAAAEGGRVAVFQSAGKRTAGSTAVAGPSDEPTGGRPKSDPVAVTDTVRPALPAPEDSVPEPVPEPAGAAEPEPARPAEPEPTEPAEPEREPAASSEPDADPPAVEPALEPALEPAAETSPATQPDPPAAEPDPTPPTVDEPPVDSPFLGLFQEAPASPVSQHTTTDTDPGWAGPAPAGRRNGNGVARAAEDLAGPQRRPGSRDRINGRNGTARVSAAPAAEPVTAAPPPPILVQPPQSEPVLGDGNGHARSDTAAGGASTDYFDPVPLPTSNGSPPPAAVLPAHPLVAPSEAAPDTEVPAQRPGQAPAQQPRQVSTVPERRRIRTPLDRAPKPKRKDRDPSIELAITEIAGHLTFTPNAVTAWYWLPEVRWAFRPDSEREALLSAISEQFAGLAGFRLHLRRTTKPFPADQWARVVDGNTPQPLPEVRGAPSWADHLVAAQQHLHAVNHAEGQTYLGITFARRTLGDNLSERINTLFKRGVPGAERRRMARTVEQFDEVLGAFGMRGRRVTAGELEWLLYRSVALCMSPPTGLGAVEHGQWDRGDLLALTEQIERYRTPYGSTVKLVNRLTGEECHVAVLAVGRMEPLEIPERHEPWLHFHERLPWPMEISSRIDLLGPGDSFRNLEQRLRLIRSQQKDYAEHGIDAPPELERLATRALTIGDDISTGLPVDSSRAHGWHRIAVGAQTQEECLERARRLTKMYSREMRVALQHPKNQDWLAREFIPGEPLANTGYLRRMPVKLLAAALPQAASTVGDRRGDLIGRTAGTSRRPVFLDLHFPMEVRERSGLAVFVAEPGGGKSTLLGALGYLAARRGVQVTLLDPSGPLARLCAMPELAPYSRVLNLTGSERGTLAPYSLIPTPQRKHYVKGPAGDREFEIAISNARAERRMLVQDICMMLVPPQVAREASTATLLRHAVRQVPAEETSTVDDVVRTLHEVADSDGRELGNLLLDTAEMPLATLFFGSPEPGLLGADAALTVITMAGLRLPDLKIEREYWSAEESLALPMLHTAHRLAVRRCYGGDMGQRKLVGLDEAHFMEGWRSGRSFLVRLARDSRKWNLAALVASQNPKDILGLDVQNLVSTVFVGRIAEDSEIAAEALRLLRVPVDVGYEQTLAALSQADVSSQSRLGFREFVMRDVDGRVQKVRVDVSYVPELLKYLDTTPAAAGPKPVERQPHDADESEV